MLLAGSVDINEALSLLAVDRPVFHSEADFRFALAWTIRSMDPDIGVRLERPAGGLTRLDIELFKGDAFSALELKYLTKPEPVEWEGERYVLRSRALDKRRYDVVKDIGRVETYVAEHPGSNGAVIVIASDDSLWRPSTRSPSSDHAFRIHHEALLTGELTWGPTAGSGSTRGRDLPLRLTGTYKLAWREYASTPIDMRALVVPVVLS